jgi:hypothetical protein
VSQSFKGQTKGELLLKILPVAQIGILNQQASSSLEQEVYFGKYLWGGVGYWLLTEPDNSQALIYETIATYIADDSTTPFARTLVDLSQQFTGVDICSYVCTEREIFRPVYVSFVIFMILISMLRSSSHLIGALIDRFFYVYGLLWIAVFPLFIAWLGCDELWQNVQEEALLMAFVVVVAYCLLKLINKRETSEP